MIHSKESFENSKFVELICKREGTETNTIKLRKITKFKNEPGCFF